MNQITKINELLLDLYNKNYIYTEEIYKHIIGYDILPTVNEEVLKDTMLRFKEKFDAKKFFVNSDSYWVYLQVEHDNISDFSDTDKFKLYFDVKNAYITDVVEKILEFFNEKNYNFKLKIALNERRDKIVLWLEKELCLSVLEFLHTTLDITTKSHSLLMPSYHKIGVLKNFSSSYHLMLSESILRYFKGVSNSNDISLSHMFNYINTTIECDTYEGELLKESIELILNDNIQLDYIINQLHNIQYRNFKETYIQYRS